MFQQRVQGFRLVYGTWEVFQDNRVLLVQNVSYRASVHDMYMVFSRHGTLKVVDILLPREEDSRTLAFIKYQHAGEAQKAMALLHGAHVHGHKLLVQNAKFGRLMAMDPPYMEARAPKIAATAPVPRASDVEEYQAGHALQYYRGGSRRPREGNHERIRARICNRYYENTRQDRRHDRKSKIPSDSPSQNSFSPMDLCPSSLSPPPGFCLDRN